LIVLDCSYAVALVMPDEPRPASLAEVVETRLLVPSIWAYEVANTLRMAVRRSRVSADSMLGLVSMLEGLKIEGAGPADTAVRQRYLAAQSHDLTAYDAAYIELALQHRCALATLDARLATAARQAGLHVLA